MLPKEYKMYLPLIQKPKTDSWKDPNNFMKINLYYRKGGINYFSGGSDPAAIWLSVTPIYRVDGMERHVMSAGRRIKLEETNRLNRHKLLGHAKVALAQVQARAGEIWDKVKHVVDMCGEVLQDVEPVADLLKEIQREEAMEKMAA
jgi:hypothetical protein